MWAITAEYWDKCVSKVMKEAYEYMIFDGVITLPEETSADIGDDDSESEVILSIENKTETTQVSTMSDDHTYSSDRVILKNQIIKQCTVELISPKKLAAFHGFSESTIKRWVKRSGATLPGRYQQPQKKIVDEFKNTHISNPATEHLTNQLIANLKSKWPSLTASVTEPIVEQSSSNSSIVHEVTLDPQPSTSKKQLPLNLKCLKCDFKTSQKNYLEKHIQSHKDCEHCGETFHGMKAQRQLTAHLKTHRTVRTVCDFCNNRYTRPSSLKRHEKTCQKKNELLQ